MAVKYFLAPNPRYQGRDTTGQPCIGGKLYTYENGTLIPKETYSDPDGDFSNTNPVILDNKGEANIYWADDDLYTIKLFTSDDVEVLTQDNYPTVGNDQDSPILESTLIHNIVRNPQFSQWSNSIDFPNIKTAATNWDFCADDWLYSKTCADSIVEIKRVNFQLGQTEVPSDPVYHLRYICTGIGSGGETNSNLYQRFDSVQTFNHAVVTPSIALRCLNSPSAIIEIYIYQNFGTGGSPTTQKSTLAITATITNSWQTFNPTDLIQLQDINGSTPGTNGDDCLIFSVKFPSDQTCTIDVANAQLIAGSAKLGFDFISQNDQFKRLDRTITQGVFTTGDAKATIVSTALPGWLLCNDGTIGSPSSGASYPFMYTKALFKLLWASVSNAYAPIFDSAGAISTRGVDSETDFNANKRLALTKTLGRVIASAGQGHLATTFTAAIANPGVLTLASDITNFYYAVPVTLTTTGTLPAGLSLATTYYVWNNNAVTPNTIILATTPQRAIDGIGIQITTTGTGIHTITINYSTWLPGQYIGAEQEGLIESEMPSHNHPTLPPSVSFIVNQPGSGGGGSTGSNQTSDSTTGYDGGSTPHNNLQPTVFLNYMIKL